MLRQSSWVVLLVLTCGSMPRPTRAQAAFPKSVNVVIVGGATVAATCSSAAANYIINGGCLPVTGPSGELGDFTFSGMATSSVSAANLAPYDTAVLNIASSGMRCDTGALTEVAKADLVTWVSQGHKLIIYDSECQSFGPQASLDYSWLPYPFATANPGDTGMQGKLTIAQNTTLGSNVSGSPSYLDAVELSNNAEVGDANVMTSTDSHWQVVLAATNALSVTGAAEAFALYLANTDTGLLIYNGLDQDPLDPALDNTYLRKIWVLELQQPFNPSGLCPTCRPAMGIALTPATATNPLGTSHTVTASVKDVGGSPQSNVAIAFAITAGPNQGISSGRCNPATCVTGASGQVAFTYTDTATSIGTDTIQGCLTPAGGSQLCATATKTWQTTAGCAAGVAASVALAAQTGGGTPPEQGAAGAPAVVAVTLTETPPPCAVAFQFDASYDSTKVTLASATAGPALAASGKDVASRVSSSGNSVRVVASGLNQNTIGNGDVADLTFNLVSGFTSGSTALTLSNCLSGGANANAISTSCTAGTIFSGCTCDVNRDGVINILDVVAETNQVLGISPATCDLNHDGSVNVLDVQKVINAVLGLGCN
jgi:hypothetical protein